MRRSCWREESENEAREEEQIAGGATAALGGEARYAREELLRLAEWGVLRSDSLNAELRWHDIGEARVLAGATGRHPAGIAGMRSPRGAACLTRSGAARGRTGPRRSSWAEAKAGMRGGCWAGFGRRARSEAAAREEKKYFSKYSFKEFLHAIFQILF